jgi:hypothetical protein
MSPSTGIDKARQQKIRRASKRQQITDAYGGKCTKCGEDRNHLLTIEHIGGVLPHYKLSSGKRASGESMLNLIIRESYPDYITILCFNCNCGGAIVARTSS